MFTAKVKMPRNAAGMLAKFNLESGGKVQQTIDKAVIDYSMAYCPMDTGALARSAYSATRIGSGEVVYPGPYAHYMYYGEVYGPNIPVFEDGAGEPTRFFSKKGSIKSPTGKPLQYSKAVNPLAGPFWVDRMKADRINDIVKEAVSAATGKQH